MKKIIFYIFLTIISVVIGLTTYFIISLRPININIYSSNSKEILTLNNIKVYSYKYEKTSLKKKKTVVYYRDLNNILVSINKNIYYNKKINDNNYIFLKNKMLFSLKIDEKSKKFEARSLEIGFDYATIPFIDDFVSTIQCNKEEIINLNNYNILNKNSFEGLIEFYKSLNIKDLIIEKDMIIKKFENENENIIIKKINDYEISIKIECLNLINN